MSRVIAELLGVNEPSFHMRLRQLERQAGRPSVDIRLATDLAQAVRLKTMELDLDPNNTTGLELFKALEVKFRHDEITAKDALKLDDADPIEKRLTKIAKFLATETANKKVFTAKPSAVKAVLKKLKPKATMKALGYRSMDSMFKHESAAALVTAAQLVESSAWQKSLKAAYKELKPKDFGLQKVTFEVPKGKKWPQLAKSYTDKVHHNVLPLVEVGAVVLLPVELELEGTTLLAVVFGFHAFEEIRARCALLKLQQVKPDFTDIFVQSIDEDPVTSIDVGGQTTSWRMVHWFYGSHHAGHRPDLFDPHLQFEDFENHKIGHSLGRLHDSLLFWDGTHVLAKLDGAKPVSLNILDVAVGVCNKLGYRRRISHFMKQELGREFLARYLHFTPLQGLLEESLTKQLAPEYDFEDM